MSLALFIVGALALIAGAGMIGFGIPINEFSFGNTLILAGTTAAVGGLVIIGLGAVVAQIRRLIEVLNTPLPMQPSADLFAAAAMSETVETASAFAPLPEPAGAEPPPAAPPVAPPERLSEPLVPAPSLRNPDTEPVAEEAAAKPHSFTPPPPPPAAERRPWRTIAPSTAEPAPERERKFESAWSMPEPKAGKPSVADETKPEPKPEPGEEPLTRPSDFMPPPRGSAPRAVAILKSGVVDGMGYTLYVDGSIEAELPQGTLRFASINELRSYLEKSA